MKCFFNQKALRLAGYALVLLVTPNRAYPQENTAQEDKTEQTDESRRAPRDQDQNQSAHKITAVPNRPTFSTTAEAVQRGVIEVEYGIELADGHQNINGLIQFGVFKN